MNSLPKRHHYKPVEHSAVSLLTRVLKLTILFTTLLFLWDISWNLQSSFLENAETWFSSLIRLDHFDTDTETVLPVLMKRTMRPWTLLPDIWETFPWTMNLYSTAYAYTGSVWPHLRHMGHQCWRGLLQTTLRKPDSTLWDLQDAHLERILARGY